MAPISAAGPAHPTPASTGRLSPLPRREDLLVQRYPRAVNLAATLAEAFPQMGDTSKPAHYAALEARCAVRGEAAFSRDCIAFADERGIEPTGLGWFAAVVADIPETAAPRKPGELPRWGDPDFDDPTAYPDYNAYQARSAPASAVPITGPSIR